MFLRFNYLGGEGTQKLKQVEVDVFTNSHCENAYKNSTIGPKTFPMGIKKSQLCAGSSEGGKDACQVRKPKFQSLHKRTICVDFGTGAILISYV